MNPTGDRNPYDPAVRSLGADLLGYLRLPGGTVPSGFTYALFELWAKADESNREAFEKAWLFAAFVLRAYDTGGEAGLREIVEG